MTAGRRVWPPGSGRDPACRPRWGALGALGVAVVVASAIGCGPADPSVTSEEEEPAALVPTVWPDVVPAGVPTEVVVSVAPRGEVDGPVTYEAGDLAGMLTPDGGGVHSAELVIETDADVEVAVAATVDGAPATGSTTIAAADTSLPTTPAPAPVDPDVHAAPDGGHVLADRIVLTTDPDISDAGVLAIAERIDATVVGRLSAERWQLELPPTDSYEHLAGLLDGLEGTPGLVDVTPVSVGEPGGGGTDGNVPG